MIAKWPKVWRLAPNNAWAARLRIMPIQPRAFLSVIKSQNPPRHDVDVVAVGTVAAEDGRRHCNHLRTETRTLSATISCEPNLRKNISAQTLSIVSGADFQWRREQEQLRLEMTRSLLAPPPHAEKTRKTGCVVATFSVQAGGVLRVGGQQGMVGSGNARGW